MIPLRGVLLLGAGGFGECWWDAIEQYRLQVVGVVDPDPRARERLAARAGVLGEWRFSSDTEDWLTAPAALVIDSSPPQNHVRHGTRALAAGRHFLVAKPMASTLAGARELVAAARASAGLAAVAQQMRYFGCFRAVRELVASARLGSVRVACVRMRLDGRGWEPGTEWRLRLAEPLLTEAGTHHLDLLRWVLGDEFDVVSGRGWRATNSPFRGNDTVFVQLRSERGADVLYQASFAPNPEPVVRFDSGWDLVCERGTIRVRDGAVIVEEESGERTTVRAMDPAPEPLEVLNARLLGDFLAAIDAGRPPGFNVEDNLVTMTLLTEAIDACHAGAPVR